MYHSARHPSYSEFLDIIMSTNIEAVSSSLEDLTLVETDYETDAPSTVHAYDVYNTDDYLSTLQSLKYGDFSDEKEIKALPRRRTKSQKPLAIQLVKTLYPEMPEIAAIINYERLTLPAKAFVREKERERLAAELYPKNNSGRKLLKIQGPGRVKRLILWILRGLLPFRCQ
jgi:hypothetical protein